MLISGAVGPSFSDRAVTFSPSWTLVPTHWCRNTCGYCVFVEREGPRARLVSVEAARAEMRRARAAGAAELLIMSGEGVEQSAEVRAALRAEGCGSYVEYLARVSREALGLGLLPHVNVGNVAEADARALAEFVPSMGMMLETADAGLRRKAAHRLAPDKEPARRLATLEAAGRARMPFTTGILVGVGEDARSREDSLRAVAAIQRAHGHVQEVIIQPFTPHAGTAMAEAPAPSFAELRAAVEAARDILPAEVVVQVPPNLAPRFVELVEAGARDLGGVSPDGDRINPLERWLAPRAYADALGRAGFTLRPRLAVHERFVSPEWLRPLTLRAAADVRRSLPLLPEASADHAPAARAHV